MVIGKNIEAKGVSVLSQTKLPQPVFPPQHQDKQPGVESQMNPLPLAEDINYLGSGKLEGKVAFRERA